MSAIRIAPDWMARFAASHFGLFCLSLSHKKDATYNWLITNKHIAKRTYDQLSAQSSLSQTIITEATLTECYTNGANINSIETYI